MKQTVIKLLAQIKIYSTNRKKKRVTLMQWKHFRSIYNMAQTTILGNVFRRIRRIYCSAQYNLQSIDSKSLKLRIATERHFHIFTNRMNISNRKIE